MKDILIESVSSSMKLVEGNNKKLPSGVLCILEGQIGTYDIENANKRVYPKVLWERVISNPDIQEKLASKKLYGEGNHPATLESSVDRVSHCMRRIWLDEETQQVMGRLDVLDTPLGRIVNTLARYGSIGISSRGSGELNMTEGKSIVDPESYEYITHDIVIDPACLGSYPQIVVESIARQDIKTKEVKDDFDFYQGIYKKLGVDLNEIKQSLKEDTCPTQETQKQVENLLQNVRDLTETIETFKADPVKENNKQLVAFIQVLEESRDRLQDKLDDFMLERTDIKEELDRANVTIAEQKTQIRKLEEKNDKDKSMMERRQKRISTTNRKKMDQMENKFRVQIKDLVENNKKLESKTAIQEKQIRTLNTQLLEKNQLVEHLEQGGKSLKEEYESLKEQHTMLRIRELLLIEKVEETKLRKFMEARNLDWGFDTVKEAIPSFKRLNEGNVFVENSEVKVQESMSGERLRLMLHKMK